MRLINSKQKFKTAYCGCKVTLLILLYCFSLNVSAQVTIGSGEAPLKGAVLQLKEIENVTDSTRNAYGGLALPRVTLSEKKELYPMFLADPDNPMSGPSLVYSDNKSSLDKSHTGLIVYNLVEDPANDLCKGLNQWDGSKWSCFESRKGQAVFTISSCDDIVIGGKGTYMSGNPLDASHYLQIKIIVTEAGSYNITGIPEGGNNGYYFIANGEFLATGEYTIMVPGFGTPTTPSADQNDVSTGDKIELSFNQTGSGCENIRIHIVDSTVKPNFSISCGTARIIGVCEINKPLNANFIVINIVGDISQGTGARAILKTNTVDGFYYISNPIEITGGSQTITLQGVGTPTAVGTKVFTITSNSTSNIGSCTVNINVVMPKKRILAIGTETDFGYNIAYQGTAGGAYDLLHDQRNFGTLQSSVVQIDNLEVVSLGSLFITSSNLTPYLSGTGKADMIVISYSSGWDVAQNASVTQLLSDYVKNGNPLFLMADNNYVGQIASTSWKNLLNKIFDTSNIDVQNIYPAATGYVFRFSSVNHPILNGPFGDVRGEYWGEDASYAQVALNLPTDQVFEFSGVIDASTPGFAPSISQTNGITCFAHRTYPFVFVGDGGFVSHNLAADATICPFKVDSQNFPTYKYNYGRGTNKLAVSNSIFFANVLAWGLKLVQGIE